MEFDPRKVLGVGPKAAPYEIVEAFLKRLHENRSALCASDVEKEQNFQRIIAAYNSISGQSGINFDDAECNSQIIEAGLVPANFFGPTWSASGNSLNDLFRNAQGEALEPVTAEKPGCWRAVRQWIFGM